MQVLAVRNLIDSNSIGKRTVKGDETMTQPVIRRRRALSLDILAEPWWDR